MSMRTNNFASAQFASKYEIVNGKDKVVCVRNMEPTDIAGKVALLKESSGNRMKVFKKPVISTTESVRGIWSPFHAAPHKI